jgi:hypothetical protein
MCDGKKLVNAPHNAEITLLSLVVNGERLSRSMLVNSKLGLSGRDFGLQDEVVSIIR